MNDRRHIIIITRRRHKIIVAGGILACGLVGVLWPELSHVQIVGGTCINLVWLLVEPAA